MCGSTGLTSRQVTRRRSKFFFLIQLFNIIFSSNYNSLHTAHCSCSGTIAWRMRKLQFICFGLLDILLDHVNHPGRNQDLLMRANFLSCKNAQVHSVPLSFSVRIVWHSGAISNVTVINYPRLTPRHRVYNRFQMMTWYTCERHDSHMRHVNWLDICYWNHTETASQSLEDLINTRWPSKCWFVFMRNFTKFCESTLRWSCFFLSKPLAIDSIVSVLFY